MMMLVESVNSAQKTEDVVKQNDTIVSLPSKSLTNTWTTTNQTNQTNQTSPHLSLILLAIRPTQ